MAATPVAWLHVMPVRSLEALTTSRPSSRQLAVGALLLGICLSPRIPVALPMPGRAFDLRLEDLVLAALLPFWLARRRDLAGRLGALPAVFLVYLGVTLVSSVGGVVLFGVTPLRAAAYWGKNVEFLLIALLVATWTREQVDRQIIAGWLVALGLANVVWFAIQLVLHQRSALFKLPIPGCAVVRPNLFDSYGPGLIGEVSPLSTGGFMMILFLLAFALFLLVQDRGAWWWLAAAAAFLSCTVLSQSRVSIAGTVVGAALMAIVCRRYRRGLVGFALAAVVAAAAAAADDTGATSRLLVWSNIQASFLFRVHHSYEPMWLRLTNSQAAPGPAAPAGALVASVPIASGSCSAGHLLAQPGRSGLLAGFGAVVVAGPLPVLLVGTGNGAMGTPGLLPSEAHNHFLRVFLESGLFGLAAFTALLVTLLVLLLGGARRPAGTLDRALVYAALAAVCAFLVGATLQDMFLPVIPNELLWALVGLAGGTGLLAGPPPARGLRSRK